MRIVRNSSYHSDLRKIVQHISKDNPTAALGIFDRIESGVGRLAQFPNSGRGGRIVSTRELVISGTPYIVVYSVGAEVTVLRVLHGAQKWPKHLNPRS